MSKQLICLGSFVLMLGMVLTSAAQAGLVGWWRFEDGSGDIAYDSINENHAAVMGDPMWQRESGQIDGALQFDGVDDYLAAPFILDPVKQPFSAFAWIKGGQPGQTIISQQGGFGEWLSVDPAGALASSLLIGDVKFRWC